MKISYVIPTLNSEATLGECLEAITAQKGSFTKEIVIADGGSVDKTREIAARYGARIVENHLKTGEAGKAAGLRAATGDFIALVDSDNILPDTQWLAVMMKPFEEDPNILITEPIRFTYRKDMGYIDRYCALIGMNDPLVYFLGNYDRECVLSGKWTGLSLETETKQGYIRVVLDAPPLPTIGANGTMFRRSFFDTVPVGDYLFDIDLIAAYIVKNGSIMAAKTDCGIVHYYCGRDIGSFMRKQKRRVKDYFYYRKSGIRSFPWESKGTVKNLVVFGLFCLFLFPLFIQSVIGFFRKRDCCWLFHPLACWATLWIYGISTVMSRFSAAPMDRQNWQAKG